MPIARFEMPDGRIAKFEVPEGTSPEQAQTMAAQYFAPVETTASRQNVQSERAPDRKSTRLNSSHTDISRMPSSA